MFDVINLSCAACFSPLCAFLLSAGLVGLSIKPARMLGWVDWPSSRKRHPYPVPLTGGVAMCAAFCLNLLLLPEKPHAYPVLIAGLALLTLVGLYDDLRSSWPVIRFLFHIGVVLLMALGGQIVLNDLGDLLGLGNIILGDVATLFTLFGVVGIINAFNMMDGIDGLAGGLALIATGWLMVLNHTAAIPDDVHDSLLVLAMVIAGFLCFNVRHPWRDRASVFMGEAGSTMLGFVLGWFMVYLSQSSDGREASIKPMTAVWILALPLLDAVTVMIRRIRAGHNPFVADRQHLHHLLIGRGLSDGWATLALLASAAVTGAAGVLALQFQVPEYIQFYAFVLLFLLYYRLTTHACKRCQNAE